MVSALLMSAKFCQPIITPRTTLRVTTILDHTTLNITSSSHLVNSHCNGDIKSAELLRQTNNCDPVICPTSRVQNVSIVCAVSGSRVAKHRLDIRQRARKLRAIEVMWRRVRGLSRARHSTARLAVTRLVLMPLALSPLAIWMKVTVKMSRAQIFFKILGTRDTIARYGVPTCYSCWNERWCWKGEELWGRKPS